MPRIAGLAQAAAAVTAVFSLATLAGHLHRYLELFSHFRLQYLIVAVLLAVSLFVLRSRRWALIMLVIAAINVLPVAPWYSTPAQAATASHTKLRLLHANLLSSNSNLQSIVDVVVAERPDIIFLQEVSDRWLPTLAALAESYPHSRIEARPGNFGIAILSRTPFKHVEVIESPPLGLPSLLAEQELGGHNVTFVSTHPIPPLGAAGFEARNAQLRSIANQRTSIDGPYVLVGDLNTTMWSSTYARLVEQTQLVDARHGFGILPTWPTHIPIAMIPIDHCLVSRHFEILDVRTGPRIGSDHLPLIVDLALLPKRRN